MKVENQEYFERQGTLSMQCGMHCINNLMRRKVYKKKDMENICKELSGDVINPHKHILGGDYDANVIMCALQKQNCECQWLDRRKKFQIPESKGENYETLGFLLNVEMPKKAYHKVLGISGRHWSALRKEPDGNYSFCDSIDQIPKVMKSESEMLEFVESLRQKGGETFWVYSEKRAKSDQ